MTKCGMLRLCERKKKVSSQIHFNFDAFIIQEVIKVNTEKARSIKTELIRLTITFIDVETPIPQSPIEVSNLLKVLLWLSSRFLLYPCSGRRKTFKNVLLDNKS